MKNNIRFFLKLLLLFTITVHAEPIKNVWDVLQGQLKLNHEITHPEVQQQLRWLIAHPGYLQQFSRSEPYIYHIINEIQKRNLPGELALLPMIESSYDPFAYSGAGAAGLWQIMPGTANDLGLKQNWWLDARRSIGLSTSAALNYLTHLHDYFKGNWTLAIAAYDAGDKTVSNAIKKTGRSVNTVQFWQLQLPHETKKYIPRLLALAEIIRNPQRFKVRLPYIPHIPYFGEVRINNQIDLNRAAKLAEMSYNDLIKLNPEYNRWLTTPNTPFKLLIPLKKISKFYYNLYVMHRGIPEKNIANRAIKPPPININTYKVLHIVQPNETLQFLSQKYQVSSTDIRRWNNIANNTTLNKNQQLIIWRKRSNLTLNAHANHRYMM